MSQDELLALLERTTRLLEQQLRVLESGGDLTEQEEWQRCFGKESVVGVLAKLVAMHKQLHAEDDAPAPEMSALFAPMTDEDWALLERCVTRWQAGKED